jgi:hypothetical protein
MSKELVKELINSITDGSTMSIESAFNDIMRDKISAKLNDMRIDVAQGMFGGQQAVEESVELDEEQLDEVGNTPAGKKVLVAYAKKAMEKKTDAKVGMQHTLHGSKDWKEMSKTANKRGKGIDRALNRLATEEVELEKTESEE